MVRKKPGQRDSAYAQDMETWGRRDDTSQLAKSFMQGYSSYPQVAKIVVEAYGADRLSEQPERG